MSGFAGVLSLSERPLEPAMAVAAMGRAIAHRGLEAPRYEEDRLVQLVHGDGHTSPHAFTVVDGPAHAARVALAWGAVGPRVFQRVPGPFALVVWDRTRRRLFLARDPFGARPLFWTRVRGGEQLLFASELKALFAHPDCPRALDWTTALTRLAMPRRRYAPTSWFHRVECLGQGECLTVDRGEISVHRWDALRLPPQTELEDDPRSAADFIDGLREALVASVEIAVGAEPERAGLQLSGGIDSLAIAAIAARRGRIPTFTVLSRSTAAEARLAHEAAATLGLDNHQVLVPWHAPLAPEDWRRLLWQAESPLCGAQHYYKHALVRHAATLRPEIQRMLSGEGSDELMGADFANHGEDRPDGTLEDYLADLADKQRSDLHGARSLAIDAWMGRPVQSRAALARDSGRAVVDDPWRLRLDYTVEGLAQDVLWRDDRLAASAGMSALSPYLDQRVWSVASRVPPRHYRALVWKKRMLREALRGIVPEPLRNAPKTPFYGGVDATFTSKMLWRMLMADDGALVREAFDDGYHPELAPGLVDALIAEGNADPARNVATVLLTLVNLALLERMAREAAVRPDPATHIAPPEVLASWDDAAEWLGDGRPSIDGATVLDLAPGVELVRKERSASQVWYVVVEDRVRYVLDDAATRPWCEVLRELDGITPLGIIAARLGHALDALLPHAEEALAFEVVAAAR